jgi:transposase
MSPLNSNNLPNEVTECHQIILQMQEQMQSMQGQLEALLRARYGSKVESIPPGQLRLFESADEEQEEELPVLQSETGLKSHGRKRISRALPRVPQIYDISESDIPCPGCGDDRPVIGEEKSEQYDYSPASIKVIEHIRLKRACRSCAEHVVIAPRPPSVIEKGMAAPGMLAYVATSKYADHLPLNRLEGIFKRDGASISRSTMCDWMAGTARCLLPLYERMQELVRSSSVIWTDDTPVKLQDRDHEKNIRTGRVWVYIGDSANPLTVFDFTDSRKRDGPVNFLRDFTGYLQADAFSGYDCIFAGGTVKEVACWAHARRKFFDALPTNSTECSTALRMIGELYAVEKRLHDASDAERKAARDLDCAPILTRLKEWLDQQKLVSLPKSPLGKAVTYAMNNWSALNRYLDNGSLTIDNNRSERALRATAVGRKNWLFMGSMTGGKSAAIITSLIASCKAHSVNPREYLTDVLTRLTQGTTDLDSLLPHKWQPACS